MSHLWNLVKKELRELLTPSSLISVIVVVILFISLGSFMGGETKDVTSLKPIGYVNLAADAGGENYAQIGIDNLIKYYQDCEYDPAEYAGKPRLVEIWATWCGPCRKEIPRLKEVYERYHDAGFEILGYSVDQDVDALKKFLVDNEIPWKVASQKLSAEAGYRPLYEYYAINGVPEMILLDGDGKVIELDCRGVRLAKALQKLFPDVEPLDWDPATDFSARATDQNPDGN